ncbi:MAG TPA: hypothetical protein GXX56_01815 [Rhodocyclaceae bacterium]|nr:hypothetical protein [Rhodocyclaceae bacterium]
MEVMHGLMAGSATVMLPVAVDENGRLVVVVEGDSASASGSSVIATNGTALPLSSLPASFGYNDDDQVEYVDVVFDGVTYRQSLTWSAGLLASVSAWEPLP